MIYKSKLIIIGLVVVVLASFLVRNIVSRKQATQADIDIVQEMPFTSVSAEEFNRLVKEPDSFLLDVHIPEQTHIPGTDAFIPYNEIEKQSEELPSDKATPLLVYCRSGSMSRQASQILSQLGYTNIYDLAGGINSYKKAYPSITITPQTTDLGTVIYGDIAKTQFTLTNFTEKPVKISRVSTSCGCTTAEVNKRQLNSYETGTIEVAFDPAFHKDDTDLGDITRTIYIETDNADFAKLSADITAKVMKK